MKKLTNKFAIQKIIPIFAVRKRTGAIRTVYKPLRIFYLFHKSIFILFYISDIGVIQVKKIVRKYRSFSQPCLTPFLFLLTFKAKKNVCYKNLNLTEKSFELF